MTETVTRAQVQAQIMVVKTIAELIRELGSVPSGTLYGQLCGKLTFNAYTSIIAMLVRTELVRQDPSHLLTWIGPK